jgi:hypothetical protein
MMRVVCLAITQVTLHIPSDAAHINISHTTCCNHIPSDAARINISHTTCCNQADHRQLFVLLKKLKTEEKCAFLQGRTCDVKYKITVDFYFPMLCQFYTKAVFYNLKTIKTPYPELESFKMTINFHLFLFIELLKRISKPRSSEWLLSISFRHQNPECIYLFLPRVPRTLPISSSTR